MAPHPISLPCSLALPPPSHRDTTLTTPSPCWALHFMTKERLMFSNPTPSELCFSPAVTMCDDMLSALTPPLHHACISQPATSPQVVAFACWTISAPICLNRFTFAETRKSNLWTYACDLPFPLLPLLLWWKWISAVSPCLQFITTAIPLLFLPEYSFLAELEILNCAVPSVCNTVGLLIFFKLCPVFTFLQQLMTKHCELFTLTLVVQGSPSTSLRQPQSTHVFTESRIALLCHALRICVAHAPLESCPFPCLYIEVFELVIKVIQVPPLHHASLPQN